MQLVQRFFSKVAQSFFLFGPRGTEKSTLMRQLFADALWIDLLNPEALRSYSARPERLFEVVRGATQKVVVIDEVQKVPALLSVAHALIEEDKQLQFVLTGSSARKLKQASPARHSLGDGWGDLLAGRALLRLLYPFMAAELGEQFSLEQALNVGLLPVLLGAKQPAEALHAYVGMYLKEEIQAEGLVRNLESFSRFLEIISFSHTSILNVANISRECEVKRKTVENYIQILEDLLLAFTLPVFSKRAQRALASHDKIYLFDAGVFRALRPAGVLDRPEEISSYAKATADREGAALEGLVAQHLRAWNEYSTSTPDLGYWRTRS